MKTDPNVEYDYIRLPKTLCEKIKQLDNPDNYIQEYIEGSKNEIKAGFDSFDEEILGYRAGMAKLRKDFQEAYKEATDSHYKAWQEFDKNRQSLRNMAEQAVKELLPLTQEVEKLNGMINKVNTWDIQRFIEMIEKLKSHLYGEDRNIIEFLVNNYKKKE